MYVYMHLHVCVCIHVHMCILTSAYMCVHMSTTLFLWRSGDNLQELLLSYMMWVPDIKLGLLPLVVSAVLQYTMSPALFANLKLTVKVWLPVRAELRHRSCMSEVPSLLMVSYCDWKTSLQTVGVAVL